MRDRLMPAAGWFRLAAAATVSSLIAFSAYGAGAVSVTDPAPAPKCRAGTRPVPLTWGDTVRWPRNTTRAIVPNLGGSGVDLDLTLIDPAQRNLDDSNPLADLGEANSAPGQPLTGWDPRPYTGTDGEFGPGFLTIAMNSLDAGDTVTFELGFSRPVLLPDVSVGDLDFAGLGASPAEEPWSSFQDQVTLTATRAGAPVGATLTPAAGTRPPTGAPSAGAVGAVGGPYQLGVDGNLAPDDPAGTLLAKIDKPVTGLALAYSNGPDDETAEAGAKVGPATEPGATPGGAQALGPDATGTPHTGGTPHAGGTPHPDGTPHAGGTPDVGGTPSAGSVPAWSRVLPTPATSVSDSQTVRLAPFTICVGTAGVGGRITADVDGNGARSAGEPGLPGVTVELADSDGRTVATRTTGADGGYAFDALPPFDWTVRVVPATLSPGAAPTADPDGTLDDRTTIDVEPGQAVEHADFGYRPAGGTVAGTVFADRDDDGLLDPADGDGGIAGVPMALTGTDLAGNPVSLAAATGDDGAFAFRDVPAGTYLITESQPAGYDDGRDSAGGNATGDGDDSFAVTCRSAAPATATTSPNCRPRAWPDRCTSTPTTTAARTTTSAAPPASTCASPVPTTPGTRSAWQPSPAPTAATCSTGYARATTPSPRPSRRTCSTATTRPARPAVPPARSGPTPSPASPSSRPRTPPATGSVNSHPHPWPAPSSRTTVTRSRTPA